MPAIAVGQLAHLALIHRFRRQASSHILIPLCQVVLLGLSIPSRLTWRYGVALEICLAGPDADYMTGQAPLIDGGLVYR